MSVVLVAVLFPSGFSVYCGKQHVRFQLRLEQFRSNAIDLDVRYSNISVISVNPKLLIGIIKQQTKEEESAYTYLIFDVSSYFPFLFQADELGRLPNVRNFSPIIERSYSFQDSQVPIAPSSARSKPTWSLYELSTTAILPSFSFSPTHVHARNPMHRNTGFAAMQSAPEPAAQPVHSMLTRRAFSFNATPTEPAPTRDLTLSAPIIKNKSIEVSLQETLSHMVVALDIPHPGQSEERITSEEDNTASSHAANATSISLLPSFSSVRPAQLGTNSFKSASSLFSSCRNICPFSYIAGKSGKGNNDWNSHSTVLIFACPNCSIPSSVQLASLNLNSEEKLRWKNEEKPKWSTGQVCSSCSLSSSQITNSSIIHLNSDEYRHGEDVQDSKKPYLSHLIAVESRGRVFLYSNIIGRTSNEHVDPTDPIHKTISMKSEEENESDGIWKDVGESPVNDSFEGDEQFHGERSIS